MTEAIKMIKGKHNGTDLSIISFPFNFVSELQERNKFNMVMRQQTFQELREWGQTVSPTSDIHPGDRAELILNLLKDIVVKPSQKKFEDWFVTLYESEIEDFLIQFAEAKEQIRKK